MKIAYFQHVPFETPAAILKWGKFKNFKLESFLLYKGEKFPIIEEYDLFVIMGGPMSVNDEDQYSWLKEEKKFIELLIKKNKKILGICLGAQLIANVLGAKVYKNRYKEIGWFPVYTKEDEYNTIFPKEFIAFHWHGETFELPKDTIHLFYNEATKNQGFVYEKNVWAFQFHLESTEESIRDLYKYSEEDLNVQEKKYVKEYNKQENDKYIQSSNEILFKFLDHLIY